jgi:hypothetical protein
MTRTVWSCSMSASLSLSSYLLGELLADPQ